MAFIFSLLSSCRPSSQCFIIVSFYICVYSIITARKSFRRKMSLLIITLDFCCSYTTNRSAEKMKDSKECKNILQNTESIHMLYNHFTRSFPIRLLLFHFDLFFGRAQFYSYIVSTSIEKSAFFLYEIWVVNFCCFLLMPIILYVITNVSFSHRANKRRNYILFGSSDLALLQKYICRLQSSLFCHLICSFSLDFILVSFAFVLYSLMHVCVCVWPLHFGLCRFYKFHFPHF